MPLDKLMDFVLGKWDSIAANPSVFLAVGVLGAFCGYFVARWYYSGLRERIELLKDRIADLEKRAGAPASDSKPASPPERTAIPLEEAARMAFDATRGTAVSDMAEREGKDRTEGIIHWYALALTERIEVYGTWKHAAMPSLIDFKTKPGPSVGIRPNGKAAVWGKGTTEADDLYVRAVDLQRAIKDLKALGTALK